MNVEPVPTGIRFLAHVDGRDREVMDGYWAFNVPRVGDTVRHYGDTYEVTHVEWEPQGYPVVQQRANVYVEKR